MTIPTEADWRSEPWCLDTDWAYAHFQGKSLDEAIPLFEENALRHQEDLMYMPKPVFGYYLRAYIAYLMSDAAKGDADGASCFISLIDFKAEHDRDAILPLWPEIEPVLRRLAEQQDDFDAEWWIYGSFRTRIHAIVRRGFHVSFDTAIPEAVPNSVTLREMALTNHTVSWPVAVQIFHNSGIASLDATSKKHDILRVFGPPASSGGGDDPRFGHIPDWIRCERSECVLRFEFAGDEIVAVTFMHPRDDESG